MVSSREALLNVEQLAEMPPEVRNELGAAVTGNRDG
jgi:hypothetical protein